MPSDEAKVELVRDGEAAKIIHQKRSTLATWRSAGKGPAYFKVGRCVYYSKADLAAWIASRRREPARSERIAAGTTSPAE
jgi:predicted DNA-binding transcriptional regulator AlpA